MLTYVDVFFVVLDWSDDSKLLQSDDTHVC
jgi:hypothetical protein